MRRLALLALLAGCDGEVMAPVATGTETAQCSPPWEGEIVPIPPSVVVVAAYQCPEPDRCFETDWEVRDEGVWVRCWMTSEVRVEWERLGP